MILKTVLYYMAVACVVSAILAVTRKNPVHSILWVLVLFLHVAGIFLVLGAEFLAAAQVIVYAGAILIFYLFVLMLVDTSDQKNQQRFGSHWPFAILAGTIFLSFAWLVGTKRFDSFSIGSTSVSSTSSPLFSISELGGQIFGPFALPFEIVSLVLLAAIIGAVVLAKGRNQNHLSKE